MSIDTVVRSIEFALEEPGIVTVLKGTRVDSLEVLGPCEEFATESTPKLVWLGNGFFVEGLVFFEILRGKELVFK